MVDLKPAWLAYLEGNRVMIVPAVNPAAVAQMPIVIRPLIPPWATVPVMKAAMMSTACLCCG